MCYFLLSASRTRSSGPEDDCQQSSLYAVDGHLVSAEHFLADNNTMYDVDIDVPDGDHQLLFKNSELFSPVKLDSLNHLHANVHLSTTETTPTSYTLTKPDQNFCSAGDNCYQTSNTPESKCDCESLDSKMRSTSHNLISDDKSPISPNVCCTVTKQLCERTNCECLYKDSPASNSMSTVNEAESKQDRQLPGRVLDFTSDKTENSTEKTETTNCFKNRALLEQVVTNTSDSGNYKPEGLSGSGQPTVSGDTLLNGRQGQRTVTNTHCTATDTPASSESIFAEAAEDNEGGMRFYTPIKLEYGVLDSNGEMVHMPAPEREMEIDRNSISDLEKRIHFEFFENRCNKTPERYRRIRNHILDQW